MISLQPIFDEWQYQSLTCSRHHIIVLRWRHRVARMCVSAVINLIELDYHDNPKLALIVLWLDNVVNGANVVCWRLDSGSISSRKSITKTLLWPCTIRLSTKLRTASEAHVLCAIFPMRSSNFRFRGRDGGLLKVVKHADREIASNFAVHFWWCGAEVLALSRLIDRGKLYQIYLNL